MTQTEATPFNARPESEVFADLRSLCASPGFIHAIAYFCWRDNLVRFSGNQITEKDLQHQYSQEQLIRTEIATLIGLMAKSNIDTTLPSPEVMQGYVNRSEALLHEMHMSLQKPWISAFKEMARSPAKAKAIDPFSTAEGLREPIFYGGESAYNFQYEELAQQKYQADNPWLDANVGFTIDEACDVINTLGKLQLDRTLGLRETMALLPPDKWTFLPGFTFNTEEISAKSSLPIEKIERVISAFRFAAPKENSSFASLSDFNETNAAPIIRTTDGSYYLFQHYSLLEALYEAPFFWMVADKTYRATASKNRGDFAENFLTGRLTKVFGAENVFSNVDIYKGKDRFAEADVLVVYGSQAIVFQAKSKRLTIEARKGNDLQLKDDFKKAIHDAYDQCQLCSDALLGDGFRFTSQSKGELKFSIKPTHIFPICVVSDHYPALSAQARQFLKIRSTKVVQNPIVSDVFFIDVLSEILDTPLHFLNLPFIEGQI